MTSLLLTAEEVEEASILDVSREPVILNIYDMFWTNDYTANVGLGVYHSGLEVYGREYAYGQSMLILSAHIDSKKSMLILKLLLNILTTRMLTLSVHIDNKNVNIICTY